MFDIFYFYPLQMNCSLSDVVDVLLDNGTPDQNVRKQEEVAFAALVFVAAKQESFSQRSSK